MLHSAQLLTAPTSTTPYKPEEISSSALQLVSSSLLFWQVDRKQVQEKGRMAQQHPRPRSRTDDTELWFAMPGRSRPGEQSPVQERSAYQATSNRRLSHRSASPSRFPSIPIISTTAATNKPLPPSPESDKKKRKAASLRDMIRRKPSSDSTHLRPEPPQHQRSSSANANLSPEPYQYYYSHHSSRSMPTSPSEFLTSPVSPFQPANLARAHSAAANYTDTIQYVPYSNPVQQQQQQLQLHTPPPQPQRAVSMNTYFEPSPPVTRRTFPDTTTPSSATPRESVSDRPRPHTWLSPTERSEPFDDASEFRLFAEATSGLPPGALDFDVISPTSPTNLQGSLFARGRQTDRIPLPAQSSSALPIQQSHLVDGWQNMSYDYMPPPAGRANSISLTSSALPRPNAEHQSQLNPHANAINLELERLGLADEEEIEDELPNYAQSQAEMHAKKRKEATERARELEARWNSSRSWRSR